MSRQFFVPRNDLLKRVDHQATEQFRVEVGAFGRHPFGMLADRLMWSRVAGITRAANGNGRTSSSPVLEPRQNFFDQVDIFRLGQIRRIQQRVDDQTGAESRRQDPANPGCGRRPRRPSVTALLGDPGDDPAWSARAKRPIVPWSSSTSMVSQAAGRRNARPSSGFGFEAVAKLRAPIQPRSMAAGHGTVDGWATRSCRDRSC